MKATGAGAVAAGVARQPGRAGYARGGRVRQPDPLSFRNDLFPFYKSTKAFPPICGAIDAAEDAVRAVGAWCGRCGKFVGRRRARRGAARYGGRWSRSASSPGQGPRPVLERTISCRWTSSASGVERADPVRAVGNPGIDPGLSWRSPARSGRDSRPSWLRRAHRLRLLGESCTSSLSRSMPGRGRHRSRADRFSDAARAPCGRAPLPPLATLPPGRPPARMCEDLRYRARTRRVSALFAGGAERPARSNPQPERIGLDWAGCACSASPAE